MLVVDDDASIRLLCRLNVHVGAENGATFVDEIRAEHPQAKVAMLTGSVGGASVAGASPDTVIWKPFTLEQLTSAVAELV